MIGPVFFVLLETSIRKGIRSAITLNLGVICSDIIYIAIAYFFYDTVASLQQDSENGEIARIIGGILFLGYGVFTYFKKQKPISLDEEGNVVKQDFFKTFMKGFILNFLNPTIIFYWFSILTIPGKAPQIPFVVIVLITFFTIDLFKILGAKKLRPIVTEKFLKGLNHFIGIIFFGTGIYFLIQGFLK